MPKISFIVPVYNTENALTFCIESILAQTLDDIEIILINDGSSDNSAKICDAFAKSHKNITVIHKENGGAASARNAGLDAAKGEYIFFCDSDDFIEPNSAELLYEKAKSGDFDIVVFGYRTDYVNEGYHNDYTLENLSASSPEALGEFVFNLLYLGMFESSCNKFFKASLIEDTGARFPLISVSEDAMFNTVLFKASKRLASLSNVLYHYVKTDKESLTNSYHSTLFSIMKIRTEQYKNLLVHFNLTDECAKKWFAGRTVRDRMLSLINLFKKGCPFSFFEKSRIISELISDDEFKNSIKITAPNDMNEKIFYFSLKLKSSVAITAFFGILFGIKNFSGGFYRKIRKMSNKREKNA